MQNSNVKHNQERVEILVRGTVQGVGFRPFIYKLASQLAICGTVTNTSDGVVILAAAEAGKLKQFLRAIAEEAPPLARITAIDARPAITHFPDNTFSILPSVVGKSSETSIPPDISLCSDCREELDDAPNRRYQYPFTNCTNCGPRLSIVSAIPYDRPKTSMSVFPMCEKCSKEYHDPSDRRFHAQPNGCPVCGPAVSFHSKDGNKLQSRNPLADTARSLANGQIVAIKGLGGFHLAVNAFSAPAVARLRERKGRPDKPLAIMTADIPSLKRICSPSPIDIKLLTSPEHPIVLLKKRKRTRLAVNLAPGIDDIGVMLPYTPLHHVLFQQPDCPEILVMTSGNLSGTPICTGNIDAIKRLSQVCDKYLMHNRDIVTRVDDSVVKVAVDTSLIFRRARGFVPSPVQIAWNIPKTLGCGGGLKSTFSLGQKKTICTSQHIGDLDNLDSFEFYQESIIHFKKLLRFEPEISVCDLHPDYLSSHFAAKLGLPLYRVQHHHAHAVAVMAEHALNGPVLAVIMDGTGLGEDGTIWGGEILRAELTSYERLGHLSHLQMPGGDAAATEPWRMGLSALFAVFGEEGLQFENLPPALKKIKRDNLAVISSMLSNSFNSPLCSSCGRLFDAIASLIGVRQNTTYEGQAAMELETLARRGLGRNWLEDAVSALKEKDFQYILEKEDNWEIQSTRFVKTVLSNLKKGMRHEIVAANFHIMLIMSIIQIIEKTAQRTGIRRVVLAGGCLQNVILLEGLTHLLKYCNYKVYTGNTLPINDGAISFGQAVIGGLRHVSGNSNEGN